MTVSTIASIAAGLNRVSASQTNTKATALLAGLLQSATSQTDSVDSSGILAAVSVQQRAAQFRIASQNIAQSSSLLAAADTGINTVAKDLKKLEDLATQASSTTLPDEQRAALNQQFQDVLQSIRNTVGNSKFNGQPLLDGNNAALVGANGQPIANLTENALFSGKRVEILQPSGAKLTIDIIKQAQTYVAAQQDGVKSLQSSLELAAGAVETALQNQDASRSTLNEADMLSQLLGGSPAGSNANLGSIASLAAQTNRLPNNLLQLLSD